MRTKTIKKIISMFSIAVLSISTLGLNATIIGATVTTDLDRGSGGGTAPEIKVKWEMEGPNFSGSTYIGTNEGEDALNDPGAQFSAPGVWGASMNYTVCAIATDINGADDIDGVYADIYYPVDRRMHTSMDPDEIDNPSGGCGAFIEQNTLIQLSKDDGIDLFCNKIRNSNENLAEFNADYYTGTWIRDDMYEEICGVTGQLQKEEAYVYCDDKTLTWEDPDGMYKVEVIAQDKGGNSSTIMTNYFEYLPSTAFQKDFSAVSYGEVLLNVHKKIAGDLDFIVAGGSDKPTIRNVGNTRLSMNVAQDDMGLGQSSGVWNVEYDARVGNLESDWSIYDPFKFKADMGDPTDSDWTQLMEILDLSEIEEMDFSILVTKWPDISTTYGGMMWLDATPAPVLLCQI